jgi:predicted  nucleic acid-binding Zn-ribbon protein
MAPQSELPPDEERAQLRLRYRERLNQYRSLNAELSDLSWTLADLEQQIAGLRGQLGDPPEAAQARRITDLRRWKETLEENILKHMYHTEELAAEVAELRRLLKDDPVDSSD